MPRLRLCLFSPRGELLIQRRQLRKDRYPGCWDISAGGFVRSGEEPAQAVLREAPEELGLLEEEPSQVCWAGPGRVLRQLEQGEFVDYSPALISRLFAGQ